MIIMSGPRFTKMNKKKVAKPSTSSTSSQQRTLFQTWGSKNSKGPSSSSKVSETDGNAEQFQPSPDCNDVAMDTEDEDELLMQALEQTTNLNREIGTTSFEIQEEAVEVDLSSIPDLPGFDKSSGLKWIYPTNYPVRAYQFDIVKSALFQNTLVALPTGLGKTLIAAVVMFNFYRWYPLGKIVFMAPTKPLVTQQIEACYNIMGIPQLDIAEMTGKMFPVARQKAWKEKRIIFLTPQVLMNDLSRGTCQAEQIKCLVVDEAHKALGNYAYCQVIRELVKITRDFRILALSATPGTNLKMVQEVISNLLISKIELRTDDSPMIKMYSFERKVEKIVVPLGEELKNVETQYLELLESIVNRLVKQRVCYKRNVKALSKFLILKCRDEFRQNPPSHLQPAQMGSIEGDFALAMSLYHGYELLQLHGLRSFYQYLLSLINGDKGYGRTRSELMKNINFMNVHDYLSNKFGEKPSITFTQQSSQEKSEQYIIGHPKLEKLQEIVLEHFRKFEKEDGSSDTRVMIFSQYRNSVSDITEMLKRQQPLVRVISFMGQAVKKEGKGFTQKEQLRVMKQFREGNFNTLVSTCVGEEGLDIGDVDLIICFDASKSPIRLVQRMGRTGRKRDGRIVMLVTEGKEDQIYKQSQYNKNSINKALLNGAKSLHYYQQSPRMLPEGLEPRCHKMYICVKKEFETLGKAKSKKKEEKKTKNAKGKTKTKTPKITDLLNGENSMNGRLSPVSISNSPVPNGEFQPIDEDLDLLSRLNMGDNTSSLSQPNYTRLSDDELPDVSSQIKISCSKKALCDTNSKNKSNSKTTKKKSAQKENPKRKKNSKKKDPLIDRFIIVPDNDSASDFMEEPEPVCDIAILNGNGGIKSSFKSQVMHSVQEPLNSPKLGNSQESHKSENNPVNNCLIPDPPSLANIPQLLDDLEAQSSQRHSPDVSHLLNKWDEEFNDSIKIVGISSISERVKIDANLQTVSSVTLSPSCVSCNDKEFLRLSPEREDIAVNHEDGTRSPDLEVPMITFRSPQKNCHSLNIMSPVSSNLNNSSICKRKRSPQVVDSPKLRKYQRLKSPEEESKKKVQSSPKDNYDRTETLKSNSPMEPIKDNSKSVTSYGDLFADFSLSFDDAAEISFGKSPLLEKSDRNSPLLEKTNRNSLLLEKTCDRLPEPKKRNLKDSVLQDSSCSFLENADDNLPEPEKLETSDQVFEEIICEDDHPVFDLTTDMFSDDELSNNIEAKSDSIKTPAADRNHVPALPSETNPSRSTSLSASPLALGKSGSASKLSSLIFSFVNTKPPTSEEKCDTGKNDDDDDDGDLPLFELGLDFDAIPPTPIHGRPHSLISKSTHSNLGCSTPISAQCKAISASESNQTSIVRDENFFSDSDDDDLGGFRLVLPSLNVIGHLQSQSTPFSKKKNPSEDLFSPCSSTKKNDVSILLENEDEFSPSSVASQGFDLKFDDLLADDDLDGCDVPVQPKKTPKSQENQEISAEIENQCDDSFLIQKTRKKRVRLKSPSPSPQKKSTSFTEPIEIMDDKEDDSFCIRKKKKSVVLKSPTTSSQSEGQEMYQCSKWSLSPKPLHKRINFMVEERNSQDDFQEADQSFWKQPSINKTKSGGNGKLRQKSHHHPKSRDQSDGRHFLDEEAELSGSDDGHSDEEIEEDDHYEQSFINDFSQADRTQHTVDMRAVYLQSVVSPVAKHHGYKMKYGKVNVSNVYSCAPESDDDYEHDSFCVESEEESYLTENTAIEDSLLEREPPKNKNKNIGNKNKKKRVIRPESSSEEEEEIFKDQNNEPPANISNCGIVEVDLTVEENKQSSRAGPSSAVIIENIDCDDSDPLVVYADSREISGAQDIISDLRIQHKVNVVVTKLEACDYLVSLRTAVERKVMSDFANGANNKKLVQRLQEMCEYFERPCLIVEKNPQKGQDKKNIPRPIPQTKYLETLLSQLSLSPIRLLFSDSKLETCALLASLCFQEKAKGMAICRNQTLSDAEQQKMKFFSSLPKVNHALALNMCKNYKNIKEFLQSSVSMIVTRSKMSSERALYLHRFVRQQFR